jgi:hypothetical protein
LVNKEHGLQALHIGLLVVDTKALCIAQSFNMCSDFKN